MNSYFLQARSGGAGVGETWRGFVLGPAESRLVSPQPPPASGCLDHRGASAWITAGLLLGLISTLISPRGLSPETLTPRWH